MVSFLGFHVSSHTRVSNDSRKCICLLYSKCRFTFVNFLLVQVSHLSCTLYSHSTTYSNIFFVQKSCIFHKTEKIYTIPYLICTFKIELAGLSFFVFLRWNLVINMIRYSKYSVLAPKSPLTIGRHQWHYHSDITLMLFLHLHSIPLSFIHLPLSLISLSL